VLYLAQQHLDIYEQQMNAQPAAQAESQAQSVQQHRWIDEEYEMRQVAQRNGKPGKVQATFLRSKTIVHGQQSNVHLDSAIILGSKILANKKDTKYVEDALYIVGKAQFYKNDVAGAKRKFLELQSLYPDSKYGSSVQMFLARSLLASSEFDTAQIALGIAVKKAEAEHDDHSLGDAHRTLAEIIYARTPDSLAHIASELEAAEKYFKGDEAARLAYEAGVMQYMNGDWTTATASFTRAINGAKDASFEGEARIDRALAERQLGKFANAKSDLLIVSEKTKYGTSWAAAKYELAYTADLESRALVANDLRSQAYRDTYYPSVKSQYFIVDTTYRKESQIIVSRVHYREAEIMRGMGEFDTASKYAVQLIGTKEFSGADMNQYVSDRMRSLSHFSSFRNDLAHLDSLDHQIGLARKGVDVNQNQIAILHSEAVKEVLGARWRPDMQPELTREEQSAVVKTEGRLRKEKGILGAFEKLGVTDTMKFADSVHLRMANDHYDLGLAYENFDERATARSEYQTALAYHFVIGDTAKDEFRARALYTWLQLESGEKNIVRRDSLMKELLTFYGQSIYARQAITFFGGPRDPNSPAEMAYRTAYVSLRNGGLDPAKPQLLGVVTSYAQNDVAPRSLFALGVSYEESTRYDSAVFYYKRVLVEYPFSSYADALRPRLADALRMTNEPHQTARRIATPDQKTDAEKQQLEIDRVRKERQNELNEQMKRQQQMLHPNQSPQDSSSQQPNSNPVDGRNPQQPADPTYIAPPMFDTPKKR
jgi:tetratricopeptide (TPR) repeat protein